MTAPTTALTAAALSAPAPHCAPEPHHTAPREPALYRCRIRHQRTAPLRHGFHYTTHLWLIDLDAPGPLPAALRALARFRAADHLGTGRPERGRGRDGGPAAIKAALVAWCAERDADVSGCQILMLTGARSLGHVFNPLTVYWCIDPDGVARTVVAEVHNTYGARHCYLLRPNQDQARVDKRLYVSPFFAVEGGYRMIVPVPGERLHLAVILTRPDGSTPFAATVRGGRRAGTVRELLRALARDPLAGYRVPLAIRRQGIILYLRRLPVRPGERGPVRDVPPSDPREDQACR